MEPKIKPGQIYKHYKGDTYKIITLAKHTENNEEGLIVYERQTDLNHNGWRIWARPLSMFIDIIDTDGYKGPRFTFVSE